MSDSTGKLLKTVICFVLFQLIHDANTQQTSPSFGFPDVSSHSSQIKFDLLNCLPLIFHLLLTIPRQSPIWIRMAPMLWKTILLTRFITLIHDFPANSNFSTTRKILWCGSSGKRSIDPQGSLSSDASDLHRFGSLSNWRNVEWVGSHWPQNLSYHLRILLQTCLHPDLSLHKHWLCLQRRLLQVHPLQHPSMSLRQPTVLLWSIRLHDHQQHPPMRSFSQRHLLPERCLLSFRRSLEWLEWLGEGWRDYHLVPHPSVLVFESRLSVLRLCKAIPDNLPLSYNERRFGGQATLHLEPQNRRSILLAKQHCDQSGHLWTDWNHQGQQRRHRLPMLLFWHVQYVALRTSLSLSLPVPETFLAGKIRIHGTDNTCAVDEPYDCAATKEYGAAQKTLNISFTCDPSIGQWRYDGNGMAADGYVLVQISYRGGG